MKKRVLFVMHMPPPVHGAAMIGKYICNSELINETFDCQYINPTMASGINDLSKISLKKIFKLFFLMSAIRKTIKTFKPDVCYFTPASGRKGFYKSFIIVWWLKLHHKNILLHFHNKGIANRKNERMERFLFKKFFKDTKLIILSSYLHAEFEDYIGFENVFVCPNGILKTVEMDFVKQNNESKFFSILFLSNMIASKGVWLLLEACKLLKNEGHAFECNFVGRWAEISEKQFNHKVVDLGLESVVFGHGAKYDLEKVMYFEKTDLFVFPTFYENETFGLVLLEAMEHGIPCIGTYEGGIPDVIEEGKTGLLLKENSSTELAKKIVFFIKNPEVALKMGHEGRDRFNKLFTLDVFESNIVTILNKIAK
jgi:glycosyltransferase involved in cell wall biosynthesis